MGNTCAPSSEVPFIVPLHRDDGTHGAAVAYLALCGAGAFFAIASTVTQCVQPAAYGKFAAGKQSASSGPGRPRVIDDDSRDVDDARPESRSEFRTADEAENDVDRSAEGACAVNQRAAHILSDFPSGVVLALLVYWLVPGAPDGRGRTLSSAVLLCAWLAHYVQRGLIHPLLMQYSDKMTPIGIPLGGLFPNCVFASAVALHLAYAGYPSPGYLCGPRFIIGAILFVAGYVLNRWADWHLKRLREASVAAGGPKYVVPTAGPFRLVCSPNYLGELIEWCGFALMTSSLVGVVWVCFCLSTFVPRSRATLRWYRAKFGVAALPSTSWRALIPFVL